MHKKDGCLTTSTRQEKKKQHFSNCLKNKPQNPKNHTKKLNTNQVDDQSSSLTPNLIYLGNQNKWLTLKPNFIYFPSVI